MVTFLTRWRLESPPARLLILLTMLAGASCEGGNVVDREVTRAVERTVPGTDKPYSSAVRRGRWAATASWEFELTMTWSEYREWVVNQLPGFELTRSTDTLLAFVRVLEGDTYTIVLEIVQHGPPRRVRGTFAARSS